MGRTSFIEHQGKRILYMNFAGVQDVEEGLGHIAEAKAIVAGQAKNSLLTLVDIEESSFDKRITEALRDLSAHNRPYVIANATVGVSGLKRMLVTTIARATGRKLVIFDTVTEAKDWLVSQTNEA